MALGAFTLYLEVLVQRSGTRGSESDRLRYVGFFSTAGLGYLRQELEIALGAEEGGMLGEYNDEVGSRLIDFGQT